MDETKAILNAILDGQQVTNAKLEAMELRLARVEGHVAEMKEQLNEVSGSVNYLVHKAGEHDRDIHVLKRKVAE
ncbi:MAG: hypothetical protein M1602_07165 [Firmicutes bacterium]|nr:hypothetical protein [Bacillota bacterium]